MPDGNLVEHFTRWVDRTPEAVAVESVDRRFTYRELDEAAAGLAGNLEACGVRPGDHVGICLERSPDAIIAMLAVIRRGAVYVPLDPGYPKARVARMVADSHTGTIISTASLRDRLSLPTERTLLLDQRRAPIRPGTPPTAVPVSGDAPAYAMFTSGSTGTPKAVIIRHRNVLNLVSGADYAPLGVGETVLHLAPTSFDAATFEIWGALLNGARLVVAPPGLLGTDEISALLERFGVTVLWLTAALFHRMADENVAAFASLRCLLAGGDVLSSEHVRRVLAAHPGLRLVNGYGPTETTTFACCHVMTDSDEVEVPIPVGRAIRGVRLHIVDDKGSILPDGSAGELWISGAGVGAGYLGRPDLTAERFVTEPGDGTGVAYRSGDLARRRPDGVVEFLGRIDDQVKIRGFRIEPAEIETCLQRQSGIRRAVVVARMSPSGEKCLVAYLVTAAHHLDERTLRRALAAELPRYMVPAMIVRVPTIPMTANGKTDRRALPEPAWTGKRAIPAQQEGPSPAVQAWTAGGQ
ncbi:amino acid adenylation domain-containing protein [Actinoplanes sp. NPDC051475]|uniref:amino acid adenylation domain-containing protein n=1 Tax=Actinoplanes sp. NPDC051475 TaxID=3157225 RepID=UPI0034507A8D